MVSVLPPAAAPTSIRIGGKACAWQLNDTKNRANNAHAVWALAIFDIENDMFQANRVSNTQIRPA
jgi:hypothetical protein